MSKRFNIILDLEDLIIIQTTLFATQHQDVGYTKKSRLKICDKIAKAFQKYKCEIKMVKVKKEIDGNT